MRIEQLHIKNFRGIEDEIIRLNPKFTVVIGDNGMGKSSVLQALQVALGAYLQCLPLPGSPIYRRQFRSQERFVRWNNEFRDYVPNPEDTSITVLGTVDGINQIRWTRRMLENGTSHNRRDAGDLMVAVDALMVARNSVTGTLLPVIASFGTERANAQQRKVKSAHSRRQRLEKGYLAALTSKADFDGVIEWLHAYDSNIKYEKEFVGTKEAVFEAIQTAIPYLSDVEYNSLYNELEGVVKIDDNHIGRKTHSNMSDGMIAMLSLVAEIAFRCVILNGFLGKHAVKETSGVVMIDELDMHLHPKWQRHVVSDLQAAFPNIQFVVTTHSPFIVQSLNSDELFNLDKPADVSPKDLKIDDVATKVMGVDSPFSDENHEKYERTKEVLKKIEAGDPDGDVDESISNIVDPGLRALLEVTKLSKGKL